jgi:hypothetical protein
MYRISPILFIQFFIKKSSFKKLIIDFYGFQLEAVSRNISNIDNFYIGNLRYYKVIGCLIYLEYDICIYNLLNIRQTNQLV